MNSRSLVRVGAVALTLALGAAACGGGSKGGTTTPTGKKAGFNAGVDGIRNPSDKAGGTLQLLDTSDCDYWDPARTYYGHCWSLQRIFERTLMAYDAKPGNAGTAVVPDLAAAPGVASDGAKTWTYKLRDGIKFEDGTPITSKDIKYGIERVFAQDVINGGPTYVVTFLDDPKNPYPGPYKDKSADKLGLKSIETPDDKTLIFHLNQPFGDWNYVMAVADTAPVPRAKDTGAKYTFHPVASGPYKIQSYTPNKQMTFVRNPNWDKATDPFRKALPDQIVITMGLSAEDEDNRIVANQADSAVEGVGVQVATQAKILRDPALKDRSDNPTTMFTRYLAINSVVPPLNNIHCRMAVQYAINKVALQTARGGPFGGGAIATTMLPPQVPGFKKTDLYPNGADHSGDIAKAKDELTKCGQPNGFTTHIATTNKGKGIPVGEAIQAGLKRAGINGVIDAVDPSNYYSTFIGSPSNVHAKKLGVMVAGWGPDFPTGYGFFSQIVDGRNIKQQGNSDYSELNDPAINALIDQASREPDSAKSAAIWGQVDQKVMESATFLPFLNDKALNIVSSRVTNAYINNGLGGIYDFQAMGVVS